MIIKDEDVLWRRLYPEWVVEGVLSSMAFKDRRSGNVSVHWSGRISLAGIRCHLGPRQLEVLAEIKAGAPRRLGCTVEHVPTPEDPSHAQFFSPASSLGAMQKIARTLARDARLVPLP